MTALLQLAQIEPPKGFNDFLSAIMYSIGIVAGIIGIFKMLRPGKFKALLSGQPIEIKHSIGTVSRDELKQVHGRIERERKEIDEKIKITNARMDSLDQNLRTNTTMTSEMSGVVRHMDQQLQALNKTLNDYFQRSAK